MTVYKSELRYIKAESTQSNLIFNKEHLQNFKSPNGLRRGLDHIALLDTTKKTVEAK